MGERNNMNTEFWLENMKERDSWEDIGTAGRISYDGSYSYSEKGGCTELM
jgi:hypothetical protein